MSKTPRYRRPSPNISIRFFWDLRLDEIDWERDRHEIISRVLRSGSETEWTELLKFYGNEKVMSAFRAERKNLGEERAQQISDFLAGEGKRK